MNKSLGLIELKGLAATIVAVDTALKSAYIELHGVEAARGNGFHTIKLAGDVGAVQAAVDAIMGNREVKEDVISYKVIPRPSREIDPLIRNNANINNRPEEKTSFGQENISEERIEEIEEQEEIKQEEELDIQEIQEETQEALEESAVLGEKDTPTCNLCLDNDCPRHKGEPRKKCIHYIEKEK
ncbi:BMC domain-containing protein [Irregularibacter muris]|uniref:BMC domain-containing protein n=1 Tax=Irregularibacter muris TaxID=1796619 RepID=A0AAE3KYX9_9FIRM|nr:BMC domain-containing protein [Irregularibacter muris]MCR1898395.1 BMC domain-containing protein [Irregularibacter muris]